MLDFKKKLEEMFSEEDKIGIVDLDHGTGETEEEFNKGGHNREFEGQACLPDGKCLFICTNGAKYVVETLGEGAVYGFYVTDNPTVTDSEIISAEGHDFAVLRGRFIVDLWARHMVGITEKSVFDLWDKKDFNVIKAMYGDPSKWGCNDLLNKKNYDSHEVPKELQVRLGKPQPTMQYSM